MAFKKKKGDEWRDEFIAKGEFKCACGCELQLSKGDLADAIRCALPFAGKPRTWGVMLTRNVTQQSVRSEPPEPVESNPCPKCGDPVEIFVYAANLLRLRGAPWPKCPGCRTPRKESHQPNQYWE